MIYQIQIVGGVKTLVPVTGDAVANNVESGNLLPATSNAVANAIGWKLLVNAQVGGTFTFPDTAREVLINVLNSDSSAFVGCAYFIMASLVGKTGVIITCNNDDRSIWNVTNNGKTFTFSSGEYSKVTVYYRDGVTLNSLPAEGEGGEATHYSTTEQFTGKYWIDGKPIYGIVIQSPSANTTLLSGVEEIVSYRLRRTYSSSNLNSFVFYEGTSASNQIEIGLDSGTVKIQKHSGDFNAVMSWLYIEYTKTAN